MTTLRPPASPNDGPKLNTQQVQNVAECCRAGEAASCMWFGDVGESYQEKWKWLDCVGQMWIFYFFLL